MSVDTDMVRRLCRLARIDLKQAELEPMAAELDHILDHMGQLALVPTEGVDGTAAGAISLRPDVPLPSLERAVLLELAPCADGCYFLAPSAMEGET